MVPSLSRRQNLPFMLDLYLIYDSEPHIQYSCDLIDGDWFGDWFGDWLRRATSLFDVSSIITYLDVVSMTISLDVADDYSQQPLVAQDILEPHRRHIRRDWWL